MTETPSPVPAIYETIRSEIEGNILSGRWPPGFRIPSELDLCQQYGCARMTVNKALADLVRAGLILRRRKTGSVVLAQRSQNAILQIQDVKEEVLALGRAYRFALLSRGEHSVTAAEAKAAGFPARRRVIALRVLHWANAVPFCLEERLIDPVVVPGARAEAFEAVSPGPWLVEHVPWSEAEHRIGAEAAGPARAGDLRIAPETPCLVVERRTWKQGQVVTQVRLSYPGAGYRLQARFAPQMAVEDKDQATGV